MPNMSLVKHPMPEQEPAVRAANFQEVALGYTCSKFRRRFTYLEENTIKKGIKLTDLTLAQMDEIWDEGKAKGL